MHTEVISEQVAQVILPEKLPIIGSQQSFIKHIAQSAKIIAANNDLYASVMIAQAALESSWGTSDLSGRHHNLFGIKGGYRGQSLLILYAVSYITLLNDHSIQNSSCVVLLYKTSIYLYHERLKLIEDEGCYLAERSFRLTRNRLSG